MKKIKWGLNIDGVKEAALASVKEDLDNERTFSPRTTAYLEFLRDYNRRLAIENKKDTKKRR